MRLRRADPLLLALIGAQWLVVLIVASLAGHDGWIYGDAAGAAHVVRAADAIAHGDLPSSGIGLGWPLVLAPIVRITGTSLDSALPAIVCLNVLVLGPLLIASLLELGTRLGGRLAGAICASAWIVAPLVSLPLFLPGYRHTARDTVAPAAVGLTAAPAFPAAVALALAGALILRACASSGSGTSSSVRSRMLTAALAAAIAAYAGLITPPALGFSLAAGMAIVLSKQWMILATFGAMLVPGLVALSIWRHRELGGLTISLGPVSWNAFGSTMADLREFLWSNRLLQYLPIAGAIAVARLSIRGAALLAGWVGAYALTTLASSSPATIFDGGAIFVSFLPALPAYAVLAVAIPLLVPTLRTRLGRRLAPPELGHDLTVAPVSVALVLLCAVPLIAAAALSRP